MEDYVKQLEARIQEIVDMRKAEMDEYELRIEKLEYELDEARDEALHWEREYDQAVDELYLAEENYNDYRRGVEAALHPLLDLARDPAVHYGKPFETVPVKIGDLQDLRDAFRTL